MRRRSICFHVKLCCHACAYSTSFDNDTKRRRQPRQCHTERWREEQPMWRKEVAHDSRCRQPSSANPSGMRASGRFNGEIFPEKLKSLIWCNRMADPVLSSLTSSLVEGARRISIGGFSTMPLSMTSTSASCRSIRRYRPAQATSTALPPHGTNWSDVIALAL